MILEWPRGRFHSQTQPVGPGRTPNPSRWAVETDGASPGDRAPYHDASGGTDSKLRPLPACRSGGSDEGSAGTGVSCADRNDDECLSALEDRKQAQDRRSGCETSLRFKAFSDSLYHQAAATRSRSEHQRGQRALSDGDLFLAQRSGQDCERHGDANGSKHPLCGGIGTRHDRPPWSTGSRVRRFSHGRCEPDRRFTSTARWFGLPG